MMIMLDVANRRCILSYVWWEYGIDEATTDDGGEGESYVEAIDGLDEGLSRCFLAIFLSHTEKKGHVEDIWRYKACYGYLWW